MLLSKHSNAATVYRNRGDTYVSELTLREKEILLKMCTGVTNRKIASALGISPNTVKSHICKIYKKLNLNNRFQACLWTSKHLQK